MDPFSILVGSAGLADVSFRIISYLATIRSASAKIQDELTILSQEISSLIAVNETVEDCCHSWHDPSSFDTSANDEAHVNDVWKNLAMLLQQSKGYVEQMEALLNAVIGKNGAQVAGKLDGLRKTIRRQGRDGEFMQLRQRIANHQAGIQILLNALTLSSTLQSHTTRDRAVGNLSENLRRQNTKMQIRINSLRRELRGGPNSDSLRSSLGCADAVASLIRFNEHFDMPQNVSSYYTGRHKQLEQLKATLKVGVTPERQGHQKRFVIYGLGGSGKTQFCCKFAQDNREYFWGVFWVDGSSYLSLKHSYAQIARIGGVEANENAAKAWLSSLQHPWLLLIDNADDPELDVMRCLPAGERGVILITTRNPTSKQYGTEGSQFFHFDKLETEEASDLLLAAAILGYLPLALIYAGKAILDQLCSLTDYPEYYERTWNRIRRSRNTRTLSRAREENDRDHASSNLSVYSSYEMIYVGLESRSDEKAFELQYRAYEGLRETLGPRHSQVLEAQDNLASSYGFLGEEHLPLALQMSEEVRQIRTQTLGREHPLTLQSNLTVAKIQTATDRFAEAERNLGPNHLGTLAARTWLGHLYWRQERHAEAQAIWVDVVSKQRYEQSKRADGEHTDRIQAMWFLLHSYEDQGRVDDALQISEEIAQLLYDFGGQGLGPKHKLWGHLQNKREDLLRCKKQGSKSDVADGCSGGVNGGGGTPVRPKKVVKDFTF
ncbi:hypothetical protein BO86DRAFT_400523 [Aspergillus japonicus CBS 114.51]|uniref:Tetratricopeptide repeat domain-containing protein n=1 Tax=Aspergillus japonicus CBS 114.51 TaxID=1448312 RepID=A0A8T8WYU6_ASPJA|nr:hypothetical protein BO86DRAFT_400523 [Aspergillus japonicus CBS 114.51]RAH80854.1 hypothetical protein BO86DRAFT_400523 [Aspergillus japonicus CBS 114.51]